ncbi:MAG: hypothetical protein JWQ63_3412 [Mucilaginibacter sp.]|nr:hypothetical protein [Mucilaginibacter sp.]
MVVSERVAKWAVRLYPPLFFQRIWVISIEQGFRGVHVKINKSFLNKNFNNSIFGGTIFSAADPFYPLLFHQLLSHKKYQIIAWSKSSEIQFLKPCKTDMHFKINITDEEIADCEHMLNIFGKYMKTHSIDIYDKKGELCVSVLNEVYVRNLNHADNKVDELVL